MRVLHALQLQAQALIGMAHRAASSRTAGPDVRGGRRGAAEARRCLIGHGQSRGGAQEEALQKDPGGVDQRAFPRPLESRRAYGPHLPLRSQRSGPNDHFLRRRSAPHRAVPRLDRTPPVARRGSAIPHEPQRTPTGHLLPIDFSAA